MSKLTKPTVSTTVTAAIATLALAAGCTSTDTKNDYVDTVDEIRANAIDAFNQTVNTISADTDGQIEQLKAGEEAIAGAVAELKEVDVPEEAEDSHREMIAGYEDLRALFERTATEVKHTESASEALSAMSAVGAEGSAIAERIDQAITQINEDLGAS